MSDLNGSNPTPKAALIDQIVSDSIKVNATPLSKTSSIGRPIRAGGRPRKGGAPNRATLALINAEFEEAKAEPKPPPPGPEGTPDPAAGAFEEDGPLKADDIPDTALAAILDVPFMVARAKTGYLGFRLDEKQNAELTPLLKMVLEIYLPNVPSKHAPAIILAATMGTIMLKQFGDYQASVNAKPVRSTVEPSNGHMGPPI